MRKSSGVLILVSSLASSIAMAGVPPSPIPATAVTTATGVGSKSATKGYVGLNWHLGGGTTPALVLGVFSTKVKSNGHTNGGNLAFHLNLAGGVKPGKLRLSYLEGSRENLQGEVGVGYDFTKTAPQGFLGLNAPYVAAGIDGYLNPGFVPYLTIHSQGKFDKPTGSSTTTTYSCPVGYVLVGTTCNPIGGPV